MAAKMISQDYYKSRAVYTLKVVQNYGNWAAPAAHRYLARTDKRLAKAYRRDSRSSQRFIYWSELPPKIRSQQAPLIIVMYSWRADISGIDRITVHRH